MNPKQQDNHFSSFAMGATVGVLVALLFGTDEGRKIVKEVLDSIPKKYKKIPEILMSHDEPEKPRTPIITPEETPHHTTYNPKTSFNEAPPPPAPLVQPLRPS